MHAVPHTCVGHLAHEFIGRGPLSHGAVCGGAGGAQRGQRIATRVVLEDLGDRLKLGSLTAADAPVPYYFNRNGTYKREMISLVGEAPQSPTDD